MKTIKVNKTLVAGAALGGAAGAYIATHQKEIKSKIRETVNALVDAGMAKLKGKTDELKATVSPLKKPVARKRILKVVKKSS